MNDNLIDIMLQNLLIIMIIVMFALMGLSLRGLHKDIRELRKNVAELSLKLTKEKTLQKIASLRHFRKKTKLIPIHYGYNQIIWAPEEKSK